MIASDKYLNELIKAKGNGFPKVIRGSGDAANPICWM